MNATYKELVRHQQVLAAQRLEPSPLAAFMGENDPAAEAANLAEFSQCVEQLRVSEWYKHRRVTLEELTKKGFFTWIAGRPGPRIGMFLHLKHVPPYLPSEVQKFRAVYSTWLHHALPKTINTSQTGSLDMVLALVPASDPYPHRHVLHLDIAVPGSGWKTKSLAHFCEKSWRHYRSSTNGDAAVLTDADAGWLDRVTMMATAPEYQRQWTRCCPPKSEPSLIDILSELAHDVAA
jgi:hypothetical protein